MGANVKSLCITYVVEHQLGYISLIKDKLNVHILQLVHYYY